MEEVKSVDSSWNKKRIFIAVFLLSLLIAGGIFFKTRFLPKDTASQVGKSVEGVSTVDENSQPDINVNIQDAVRERIEGIKQEVSGLNILEIASSSPQVQKILNDVKALEQYPVNQVKEVCRKICGL